MKKRLGDYIKEYSVRNKENQDIPVYSVTNTGGFCQDYFGKEVASKDKSTYKIVPQGYFAYNPSRINVGSVDWQRTQERVIVSPLYNVFSVSDELDQQYLYYYLKSDFALQRIKAVATGSVRDNLKLKMLYEFPINIPELSVQKNIVDILDKIKKLERLKKKELDDLDTLVKARFVEMFGDPAIPNENYPITKLEDVADVKSSHRIFTSEFVEDGVPFYRGKEIAELARGEVPQDVYHISLEKYKEISNNNSKPLIGDLLMPSICDKGQVWMVKTENPFYYKDGRVLCISPYRDKINPQYFQYYIKMRTISEYPKLGSGSTFAEFKIFQLKKLLINLPPFDRQVQFAKIVTSVNKSKSVIQKSLDETQILFQSLMQEYFG